MSRIDELIAELAPGEVEFKPLGELLDYEQPGKYLVESTAYDDVHATPVLTAGQTFILGYTNETEGIYSASRDTPVVIFDDFTTAFKWVDFPFKAKSSAMKMLTPQRGAEIDFRFVYFAMLCIRFAPQEHARHWIGQYSGFRIPVPPLDVQREVVRILDHFTELEARRRQYTHYRKSLLSSSEKEARWMTLGDLGKVAMCKRVFKSDTSPVGDIPFYKIGTFGGTADAFISRELYDSYTTRYSHPKKGDVLISAAGTIGRAIPYDGEPAYFQDSNIVWLDNDESLVTNAFLRHWYQIVEWATDGGTIQRLYNDNIRRAKIAVPPLEEQERIVDILDQFDALTNDVSVGLPAELAARRKQYEHYRDRLLTFEEAVA